MYLDYIKNVGWRVAEVKFWRKNNAASASEIDESSDTLNLLSLNLFSLNIIYLPIKQTKWIGHKVNKRLLQITICYNKEVHKRHALLYVALITSRNGQEIPQVIMNFKFLSTGYLCIHLAVLWLNKKYTVMDIIPLKM